MKEKETEIMREGERSVGAVTSRTAAENESQSRHTPGPWVWSFFCQRDGSPIVSVEDVASTVAGSARESERAELYGVTLNDAALHPDGLSTVVCYTGNGPNAHNNARLIAAAPELLAALKALVDAEDATIDAFGAREIDGLTSAIAKSRAAIAKAEGRD